MKNWKKEIYGDEVSYYTENETGRFYCDENGVLDFFETSINNRLHQAPFGWNGYHEKESMQRLIIPEGIRVIGRKDIKDLDKDCRLNGMVIIDKLELPKTLEKLEDCTLMHCLIMEMELPVSLRDIGAGAMMGSYIHVLRIPEGFPHLNPSFRGGQNYSGAILKARGRQFKETIVDTLVVPDGYPYRDLLLETRINHVITIPHN